MPFDATKPTYQGGVISQDLRDNFNALKTQLDVEHNENGTHKDTVKKSGDTSTGDQGIKKNTPAIRLIGTEVSAKDIRIVESAGTLKIQKNLGVEASPTWSDVFSLDLNTLVVTAMKINEANFTDTTSIPDNRLATITTANKVSDTAISANIPRKNLGNVFTTTQFIQNSNPLLELDNTSDSTYKALIQKDTNGNFKVLIRRKSDSVDVASYSFSYTGNFSCVNVTASSQLISTVPTGTPPISVNSTTVVPNLNVAQVNGGGGTYNNISGVIAYTGNGTFNVPAGVTKLYVEAYGGGGGGGGANRYTDGYNTIYTVGGVGGLGGYYEGMWGVTPGASISITVGIGGAGGVSVRPFPDPYQPAASDGSGGGHTSFNGTILAYGGTGGIKGPASAGSGANGTEGAYAAGSIGGRALSYRNAGQGGTGGRSDDGSWLNGGNGTTGLVIIRY